MNTLNNAALSRRYARREVPMLRLAPLLAVVTTLACGGSADPDAVSADTGSPQDAVAWMGDAASPQDSGAPMDTGTTPADTGAPGDSAHDAAHDAAPADTLTSDTAQVDTNSPDANSPDTASPDAAEADTAEPDAPEPSAHQHTRYLADAVHSPLTPYVAANLRAIAASAARQDDVFMKVGASSTVNTNTLTCFASPGEVELDGRDALQATIDHFVMGDAAGSTPFDRATEAALSGRSAGWALDGDPSPLEREIAAINPRFALIHYGTNDMQLGTSYRSALYPFADRFLQLVDVNIEQGIVPLLFTIFPRGDNADADRWVNTYNAVIRGVGQGRQVPVVDVHLAVLPLPGRGLSGDGIHPNVYRADGQSRACVLTPEGLEYGFNVRNLVSLEALDRLRLGALEDLPPDARGVPLEGDGSLERPIVIDRLPFTHMADTRGWPHADLDTYTGCDAAQDESGPELLYRLQLDAAARLRIMVFDQGSVDIDLHLLDGSASEGGCLARDHQILQGRLPAGSYHLALDTFVSSAGTAREGPYLLIVVPCDEDDAACDGALVE